MTALVYYVGGPTDDDRNDLRHSLRSFATNAPWITEAWVVGDVPEWFAGAKMPLPPLAEKFANARQSITAFVNTPGVPDQFVLCMDDVYLTDPVTELPVCHLGPTLKYLDHLTGGRRRGGTHIRAALDTATWLINHGHKPLAYMAHTPLTLDTAKVRDFLDTYPADRLLEPFLLYVPAGIGPEGSDVGNAKVKPTDDLADKMAQDMPYLSGNPVTWKGEFGDHVRARWTEPCRWER